MEGDLLLFLYCAAIAINVALILEDVIIRFGGER